MWTIKRESHLKSQSCDLYGKHPFDRTKVVPMGWLGNTWSIDNSPELDGYTFYIDTPYMPIQSSRTIKARVS